MDMPSVLGNLGHKVILAGHGANLKHPVVGKVRGISVYKRISDVIMTKYKTHTTRLTESMVEENLNFTKMTYKCPLLMPFCVNSQHQCVNCGCLLTKQLFMLQLTDTT